MRSAARLGRAELTRADVRGAAVGCAAARARRSLACRVAVGPAGGSACATAIRVDDGSVVDGSVADGTVVEGTFAGGSGVDAGTAGETGVGYGSTGSGMGAAARRGGTVSSI